MLTRARRLTASDYRLSHPWDSARTRWLWLVGSLLYWPAFMLAAVGLMAAQITESLRLLWVAVPAMLVCAVAGMLEHRATLAIPSCTRGVGRPPWSVVIVSQAALTGLIVTGVEVLARLHPPIARLRSDQTYAYAFPDTFWQALIPAVLYSMITALFVVEAFRHATDGRWQLAAIHLVQVTVLITAGQLHPELVQVAVARNTAIGAGVLLALSRWVSRSRAHPVLPAAHVDDSGWHIRGFRSPRWVSVTAGQLDPSQRRQVEAALADYRRLPDGWPEVAGRELLVRIADLARRPGRRRRRAELDEQLAELDRLADATGGESAGGVTGQ